MRALIDARALVIGAGGLGAPALIALAARGVRKIGILEPDRVELSNLHRQILYREEDVGALKAERASAALARRFPGIEVEAHPSAFESSTRALVSSYDVVLDGTDHFESKLAISDVCTDRGVAYVFAGVVGYEGQVLAVRPGMSACVRCLFDEVPPPGAAPTCAELGILGPIAGIVAAEQAKRAIDLVLGRSEGLDQIWTYDGRSDRVRTVELKRAPDCRGCGARQALRGSAGLLAAGLLDAIDAIDANDAIDAPVLDLTALTCPMTFLETRKALDRLPASGQIWIHLKSDESARSVPRSAVAAGYKVVAQLSDGRIHRVLLERGSSDES